MVIRILDHVKQCSSYEDGEVIYRLISASIANGQDVSLSFSGVDALPSAFVNASIVRLVEVATPSAIRQHLKILDSTKQINELIRSRIAFVEAQQQGL
jgi:hypothetical protein